MFYVKQSESTAARRRVPILMVDATDGSTPETGLTLYGLVAKNGGTFASSAGTFAETGYGQYYYQFDTGEIDTLGFAGIHVTATGARNYDAIIHVTAYDAYSGSFIAPTDVWNANISAFSSAGTAGSQLNLAALPTGAGITAGDVWEYNISGVTGAGLAGSQVNLAASGGAGITSGDVWSYVIPGPGDPAETVLANINTNASTAVSNTGTSAIRDAVWDTDVSYLTSPQAGFALYQAASGATTAAEQVWNYDISAVSGAGLAGTQLNLAALPSGAGITSGDVWSYSDRTITGGSVTSVVNPVSVSTTSMAGVANTVWESLTASHTTNGTYGKVVLRADAANVVGNVTLRSAGGINMVDADVHRIDNDADAATFLKNALTGIGASWTGNIVGNVTGSVASVTSDVNVSTASMTGIASTVWNTDISAISTAGSAGTQLNLAALPSGAGITSGDVWTYATRTITGGIADTVTTVTNTVDISTQSVTDIWSEDVSAYSSPSAGFDLTQAASGAGITAGDVWDYATRTLTSGAGITAGDVWEYDISAISTAGSAGTQLNLAASPSGAGITAGDVWNYSGTTEPSTVKETLESANTNASNASAQTGASAIRDAVWDTDLSFLSGTTQAAGILYQAASGTTLNAPSEVWSYATRTLTSGGGITAGDVWEYDISAISTAGTAGSQVNLAALPAGGVGISAYDVWAFDYLADGVVATSAAERLEETRSNTFIIDNNTNNIPDSVWSYNITYIGSPPAAAGYLIQAGDATTTAAESVWTYDISGVTTAGTAGSQLNLAASPSGAGITAGDVWEYDISAISTAGSAGTQLNLAALPSGSGITAGDVWDYSSRTITGGSVTSVVDGVTVTTNNDKTGYDLSGTQSFNLTGNITGDLSGSVGSVTADVNVSTASMTGIASTVWDYVTRTLTSAAGVTAGDIWEYDISAITAAGTAGSQVNLAALPSGAGITAGDVWSYVIPGPFTAAEDVLDSIYNSSDTAASNTSANSIKDAVWLYEISPATGFQDIPPYASGYLIQAGNAATTNTPADVWSYATRTLTSGSGITAGDVWDYSTRTITGGSVTSVVNGVTVTTNNDKTGYSLSGTQSFNLTGNITGSVSGSVGSVTGSVGSVVSPVTVSTASMSGIANTVWTTPTKTITGGTVDTVTNPVTVATASMSGIANTVWTYGTRTLTSGAGATAGDIWTYNISGITASGTAGAVLNDASVSGSVVTIVNGPYRLTSIAEGTDGRIDILAESVQTIQLNCLDGFGQPFNVTGYAVVVNVYDVSGALTVTYTPTVDFASSGIVSFDIDTDVTGTTGRYTLVVELTAGAEVVQLGPIEILVRPL